MANRHIITEKGITTLLNSMDRYSRLIASTSNMRSTAYLFDFIRTALYIFHVSGIVVYYDSLSNRWSFVDEK